MKNLTNSLLGIVNFCLKMLNVALAQEFLENFQVFIDVFANEFEVFESK